MAKTNATTKNSELTSILNTPFQGKVNLAQEFLIIVWFNKPEKALQVYKEAWQIEMCFKAMKSSGFDIEKTHLQDI